MQTLTPLTVVTDTSQLVVPCKGVTILDGVSGAETGGFVNGRFVLGVVDGPECLENISVNKLFVDTKNQKKKKKLPLTSIFLSSNL